MRPYLLLSALVICLSITGLSQNKKQSSIPPAAAKASFEKKFSGSSKVKWIKEGSDYEVNFVQNGHEMSAVYDPQGTLTETEIEINKSELPPAIAEFLKKNYKGAKIKEAAKITKANGEVNYEAMVNGKDIMFDQNGNYLKNNKESKD